MEKGHKSRVGDIMWLAAALVILIADFAVKRFIAANVEVGEKFGEIPAVADFIYVRNTGAAFSMLSGSTLILSVISMLFSAAIVVWWVIRSPKNKLLCAAAALLFAGAAGNAIDRIEYKYVVDFISLKLFDFPVFNIADISIVIGAALAVLYVIIYDKKESANDGNN